MLRHRIFHLRDHADGEFAVDGQQIGQGIVCHIAAGPYDLADHAFHLVAVDQTQHAIHFDVVIIPVRGEADERVGTDQAAIAMGIPPIDRNVEGIVEVMLDASSCAKAKVAAAARIMNSRCNGHCE